MSMVRINWNPTHRELRQFAAAGIVLLPLAAWLLSGRPFAADWQSWHTSLIGGLAAGAVVLTLLAWVAPALVRPIFVGLMLVTFPIGLVVSEIVLLLIYAVAFVPVAVVFRMIGRDALDRRVDRQAASYWQRKAPPSGIESYFRQS